jgi:hypothetical protein
MVRKLSTSSILCTVEATGGASVSFMSLRKQREMATKYYKILNQDGKSPYQGAEWYLPKGKHPGKWMPRVDRIERCGSGYHICKRGQAVQWLDAQIYEVEVKGELLKCNNKCVAQQARLIKKFDTWDEQTQRLFAADCAERVSHIANDERCNEAIRVARMFALFLANRDELTAARAAAWDAAWAAGAAQDAASWAAEDAGDAGDAAWNTEQAEQTKILFRYLTGKRTAATVAKEIGVYAEWEKICG